MPGIVAPDHKIMDGKCIVRRFFRPLAAKNAIQRLAVTEAPHGIPFASDHVLCIPAPVAVVGDDQVAVVNQWPVAGNGSIMKTLASRDRAAPRTGAVCRRRPVKSAAGITMSRKSEVTPASSQYPASPSSQSRNARVCAMRSRCQPSKPRSRTSSPRRAKCHGR